MLTRLQMALARFMAGRNGVDTMVFHGVWGSVILSLLSIFLPLFGITSLLSSALIFYSVFRILSRNIPKRQAENLRYMQFTEKIRKEVQQFFLRLKNQKTYKYFRCPSCKNRLRTRRGSGEKTICCPVCQHQFTQKA